MSLPFKNWSFGVFFTHPGFESFVRYVLFGGVRFHTFNVSFDEQMWILIKFKFSSFSLMVNALCLRNLCLPQGHEDILCFLLKELLLLPFIFKPMICLELTFVCGWGGEGQGSFIFPYGYPVDLAPSLYWKKNFLFSPTRMLLSSL